jgi:hypothetical protein
MPVSSLVRSGQPPRDLQWKGGKRGWWTTRCGARHQAAARRAGAGRGAALEVRKHHDTECVGRQADRQGARISGEAAGRGGSARRRGPGGSRVAHQGAPPRAIPRAGSVAAEAVLTAERSPALMSPSPGVVFPLPVPPLTRPGGLRGRRLRGRVGGAGGLGGRTGAGGGALGDLGGGEPQADRDVGGLEPGPADDLLCAGLRVGVVGQLAGGRDRHALTQRCRGVVGQLAGPMPHRSRSAGGRPCRRGIP